MLYRKLSSAREVRACNVLVLYKKNVNVFNILHNMNLKIYFQKSFLYSFKIYKFCVLFITQQNLLSADLYIYIYIYIYI